MLSWEFFLKQIKTFMKPCNNYYEFSHMWWTLNSKTLDIFRIFKTEDGNKFSWIYDICI